MEDVSMGGKAIAVTDANFEDTVLNAEKPALVDFWAVWCGPCRVVAPIVEEIAEEFEGRAVVAKLDVDTNKETAVKFRIQAIPTLLFLKGGQEADRIVGRVDKNSIKSKLEELL
jgi:thioredoxin 1